MGEVDEGVQVGNMVMRGVTVKGRGVRPGGLVGELARVAFSAGLQPASRIDRQIQMNARNFI
jgi:hypothetical protein